MMQPSAFGVLFIAGTLLLVAFVWSPFAGLVMGGRSPAIDEKDYIGSNTMPFTAAIKPEG